MIMDDRRRKIANCFERIDRKLDQELAEATGDDVASVIRAVKRTVAAEKATADTILQGTDDGSGSTPPPAP